MKIKTPDIELDPATVVQTTNSWLLSKWYVLRILLDAVKKISILGREVYSIRGHFDRRYPCKAISEPENVKDGRYLREFLVKHLYYIEKGIGDL